MDHLSSEIRGKYDILEKRAVGGMGEIYAARHRLLGELRAIKVVRSGLADDPKLQERFLREARTAARLRHPNLVQLFDFSVGESGEAYMVLEWIDGVDLARLLELDGPPPLEQTKEIALQALGALGYLHQHNIVHRDVSTRNLMVTATEGGKALEVKLIDLGVAKRLNTMANLTRQGLFVGNLHFAAPEALAGAGGAAKPDPRSDLYSFGVVLYELLTGASPIAGSREPDLLAGHLLQPPRPFAEVDREDRVPDDVRAVVMKSLQKQPEARYQSALEFARALAALKLPGPEQVRALGLRASMVSTVAATRRSETGVEPPARQSDLDPTSGVATTFAQRKTTPSDGAQATRPGDRAAMRVPWFGSFFRLLRRRRSATGTRSSIAEFIQRHPRSLATGVTVSLLVLIVGFAGFLRGGGGQAPVVEQKAPETVMEVLPRPVQSAESVLGEMPEEGSSRLARAEPEPLEGRSASPRGSSSPGRAEGARPVALVSGNAQLTEVLMERLAGRVDLLMRNSLGEAAAVAGNGPSYVVVLNVETEQSTVEAYETLLPTCSSAVSGQIVELPVRRPVFVSSNRAIAQSCGVATQVASRRIIDELAAELGRLSID